MPNSLYSWQAGNLLAVFSSHKTTEAVRPASSSGPQWKDCDWLRSLFVHPACTAGHSFQSWDSKLTFLPANVFGLNKKPRKPAGAVKRRSFWQSSYLWTAIWQVCVILLLAHLRSPSQSQVLMRQFKRNFAFGDAFVKWNLKIGLTAITSEGYVLNPYMGELMHLSTTRDNSEN